MKVICINHFSHSIATQNYERDIYNNFHARTAKQIKKHNPNIEVEAWTPERLYKKEKIETREGVKFRIFPSTLVFGYGKELSLPMIKALKKEVESKNTIIEFHEIHNLHGLLMPLLIKGKITAQHHGGSSIIEHLEKKGGFYNLLRILAPLEKTSIQRIKIYFSLSKEESKKIKKLSPKTKVIFQTMGIKDRYFKRNSKTEARRKLNLKKNKKILLHVGRITKLKGVQYVLKALNEMNRSDIEYHILGEGPDKKEFKEYISKHGIKAKFHGYVSDKEKELFLSAADALILASNREGCPVVVMEALAKNLPVIVSDVGGIPKMIKNGREGFIIKQKNVEDIIQAINKLLKQPPKNVKKYADKYKWKEIINKRIKEYEQLLSDSKPAL